MIDGIINSAYEAIIPLRLHKQPGQTRDISTEAKEAQVSGVASWHITSGSRGTLHLGYS